MCQVCLELGAGVLPISSGVRWNCKRNCDNDSDDDWCNLTVPADSWHSMSFDWPIFYLSFSLVDLNFGVLLPPCPLCGKSHLSLYVASRKSSHLRIAEHGARSSCCFALSPSLIAAKRPDGRRHRHPTHISVPPIDMSDAAGAGSGEPDKRKSTRERRRPLAFDASPPEKKVKTEKLSKKDKAAVAKAKQEAAIKAALPSPADPTAFTKAARSPKGKLVGCALSSA